MPAKYESDGKQTAPEVTSDLVLVEHDASDNENAGGEATANGANGATKEEKLEWHRALVDMYKQIEKGAVDGLAVVQSTTDQTGQGLAKWQEEVGESLEQVQADAEKQLNQFTSLLIGGGKDVDDDGTAQAVLKVEQELGLKPGPQIKLKCIDNMEGKLRAVDLDVEWTESWVEVLRRLKEAFKRDVIFEYEVGGRVIRVQDDESFDRAIALAEGSGNRLYVVIQQAVWSEPVFEEPEPEEPEPEEQPMIVTCADRMAYSPVPYKPLLFFGLMGLAVAIAMCVCGISLFGNDGTYMLALSISIPVPYFIHGFTVSKEQELAPSVIKCFVAIAGTVMGLTVILSYAQLGAMDGVLGAIVWALSTSFYLWVSYPLFPAFYKAFKDSKNGKKKRKRKPTAAQLHEQRKAQVRLAIMLTLYAGLYMLLQYTPLTHAINLVAYEAKYKPMGILVPRNVEGAQNHIFCLGFTDPDAVVDDRPVVIFEAMEGLGQALYMSGVQAKVARVGIACAYDRAGFGWSQPFQASVRRGPENIAEELHYMLTQNPISVLVPPRTGQVEPTAKLVKPPFILVGHSVGSLYVRTFASLYPKLTAAVVQWDPLPSQDEKLGTKYRSTTAAKLPPFLLAFCTYYLEPMGLIDSFMRPTLIMPLFNGTFLAKPKEQGGIGDDQERMVARMLKRNWCPSVAKEYQDMYSGGKPGIKTVVEADNNRYNVPFVVWTRRVSVFNGMRDEYKANYTIGSQDACSAQHTGIADAAMNHPEGTTGWACVGFKVLSYSSMPYKNPHKRTCEIPGQPQLGNENPCPDILRANKDPDPMASELAPMQGPMVQAQLVDTVLNAWHMMETPVFTEFPSLPMAFTMQAFLPEDEAAFRLRFTADVRAVLGERFGNSIRLVIMQGPVVCPASRAGRPDILGQLEPGDCPRPICMDLRMCASPWDTSQGILMRRRGYAAASASAGPAGAHGTYLGDPRLDDHRQSVNGTSPGSATPPPLSERLRRRGLGVTAVQPEGEHSYVLPQDGKHAKEQGTRAFAEKAFYIVFKLVGFKSSAVQAAMDVLQCNRAECKDRPLRSCPHSPCPSLPVRMRARARARASVRVSLCLRASMREVTRGTGVSDAEARKTSPNTTATRLKERQRRDILLRDYHVSSVLLAQRLLSNNSWIVQGQGILQKCPNGSFAEGKVSLRACRDAALAHQPARAHACVHT